MDQMHSLLRLSGKTSGDGQQETESAEADDAKNPDSDRALDGVDHGAEEAEAITAAIRPGRCVGSHSA